MLHWKQLLLSKQKYCTEYERLGFQTKYTSHTALLCSQRYSSHCRRTEHRSWKQTEILFFWLLLLNSLWRGLLYKSIFSPLMLLTISAKRPDFCNKSPAQCNRLSLIHSTNYRPLWNQRLYHSAHDSQQHGPLLSPLEFGTNPVPYSNNSIHS
jgi:hypothetical protein